MNAILLVFIFQQEFGTLSEVLTFVSEAPQSHCLGLGHVIMFLSALTLIDVTVSRSATIDRK
jgi:hypothetical protein